MRTKGRKLSMTRYELSVKNNSTNPGSICIYQTLEESMVPGLISLAWLSQYAHPMTNLSFSWSPTYQFMWSETGTLRPGVVFNASQALDADPTRQNMVTLQYNGAYTFTDQQMDPQSAGRLVVKHDHSIPFNRAAVGIGISGAAAFAFQANPNSIVNLRPKANYWITFGNYEKGQVLETRQISNAAQLAFPPNVFAMTATLNFDNSWTVGPA
jgi:hypothetical protein